MTPEELEACRLYTSEAEEKLLSVALETITNATKLKDLSENIAKLALPDSATIIAKEVIKLAQQ